jgi:hypothetical protein
MSAPLRIPDDVVFEVLGEDTVLLQLESGDYFTLNGSATRAWQLIEEHGDLDRVREAMLAEYEVAEAQLSADLDRLVGDLVGRGLLARSSG